MTEFVVDNPQQEGLLPGSYVNVKLMLPGNPNIASYPLYNPASTPAMFPPQANNMTAMPMSPMPVPVGAGTVAGNGNAIAPTGNPNLMPPIPQSPQPPAWLTNSSSGGIAPGTGGNINPNIAAPADPSLDAMRRQAQAGLFAAPRPFKDERSQ